MGEEEAEIVETEGVVSETSRVKGTRIRVIDVVESYQELGWSIEKIAVQYKISPEQVLEALKYYYKHSKEVRKRMKSIKMTEVYPFSRN